MMRAFPEFDGAPGNDRLPESEENVLGNRGAGSASAVAHAAGPIGRQCDDCIVGVGFRRVNETTAAPCRDVGVEKD